MGIDSDLIRGHVDTIILKTLTSGDKYGYEIIKEVEEKSGGTYVLKQPTLYSCLNRMEGKGLISSYWLDSDIGGRRHYYKLEESGRLAIEENQRDWLASRKIIDNLISNMAYIPAQETSPAVTSENLVKETASEEIFEDAKTEITETVAEEIAEEVTEKSEASVETITSTQTTETESIIRTEPEETEQTDLFATLATDRDEIESIEEVIEIPDTIIEGFFEISNAKVAEAEDADRLGEAEREFDLSSYYTGESTSFFDANKEGNAVKPDYIPSAKSFESVTESDSDLDSVNFIENATKTSKLERTFDSRLEQEIDNDSVLGEEPDFEEDEEKASTNAVSDTTTDEDEDKDYFKIRFEEDEEKTSLPQSNVSSVESDDEKDIQEVQPDHDFSFKKDESEGDVPSSLDTFEAALHETTASIENENKILYERLENIKTYTPKYTDAEYKNILGGLTAYSNASKLKPKYNEPNMTSESKLVKDFGETRQILEREGINVKLNTRRERENPETRTYILTNKIKMVSSWIVFFFMISLLAITYIVGDKIGYISHEFSSSTLYFLVALVVLMVLPITNSVVYYSNPMKKHIPKYAPRASFLFALLFFLQCLVLIYAINLPFGFYSFSQTDYNHLNWLIPSVTSVVLLASSLVYSILFLSKRFHV